ncbi:MAG: hypothetical protein AAF449_00740 [Myxococcota bacterium]
MTAEEKPLRTPDKKWRDHAPDHKDIDNATRILDACYQIAHEQDRLRAEVKALRWEVGSLRYAVFACIVLVGLVLWRVW